MPPPADDPVLVVLCTAGDLETATRIARTLVEQRLAACVNLVPGLRSIYRWEGAVQEDLEVLLVVKTTASRSGELQEAIRRIHPYDIPEIVALEAREVEARYAGWLRSSVAPAVRPGERD